MDWTASLIIALIVGAVMALWTVVIIVGQRRAKAGVEAEE